MLERAVLAPGRSQMARFWRGRVPERPALAKGNSRTDGSSASAHQNDRFWGGRLVERAVLAAGRPRTGGSGGVCVPGRAVLAPRNSRTGGSSARAHQNARFWGGRVLERAVLAAGGFQSGRFSAGVGVPERA